MVYGEVAADDGTRVDIYSRLAMGHFGDNAGNERNTEPQQFVRNTVIADGAYGWVATDYFSWNSAFWIFNWVSNMVYPRYDLMIGDVRATQKEMETTFNNAQEGIEEMAAKLLAKDKNAAIAFLTNYTNMTAQSTFDTWKQLGTFLIVKYNDGVVKRVKDGQFERNSIGQPAGVIRPGYPKEFLEEYVKQTGKRYEVPE